MSSLSATCSSRFSVFARRPYAIGDIIKLKEDEMKEDETIIHVIRWVCDSFYDETGVSTEPYYYIQRLYDDRYPPCPIKESAIGEYYICIGTAECANTEARNAKTP
jgi:hypothetical protein